MRFIVCLECMKIDGVLDEPFPIGDGLMITNNKSHFSQIIRAKHLNESLGGLETSYFELPGAVVIFKDMEVDNPEDDFPELNFFLRSVRAYLVFLWLIKDNSIRYGIGYAYNQKLKNYRIRSNTLGNPYFNANGEISEVLFSKDEILNSGFFVGNFVSACKQEDFPSKTAITKYGKSKINRMEIAGLHLEQSRTAYDLGLKISNYCSFFECLFSTSTNELTHQLSERMALYLGDSKDSRKEIYSQVKKAYQVRSSVVHGGLISKRDFSVIQETASFCDDIARSILKNLYSNIEHHKMFAFEDDKVITDFFMDLLFRD